jgi:hypothetical protein
MSDKEDMKDCTLSKQAIVELEMLHRSLRDKRQADRVKAVIALLSFTAAEAVYRWNEDQIDIPAAVFAEFESDRAVLEIF